MVDLKMVSTGRGSRWNISAQDAGEVKEEGKRIYRYRLSLSGIEEEGREYPDG